MSFSLFLRVPLLVAGLLMAVSPTLTLAQAPPSEEPPPPLSVTATPAHVLLLPPAGGNDTLDVTTQVAQAVLDSCSGTIEKARDEETWVPVDTLHCDTPPGTKRRTVPLTLHMHIHDAPNGVREILSVHLPPGRLRQLVSKHGTGHFRVVYQATDTTGQMLPLAMRSSPPFQLTHFASRHPRLIEALEVRAGWRAIAVSARADSSYNWGYAYGYDVREAAANRALAECHKQSEPGTCWIERIMPPPAD